MKLIETLKLQLIRLISRSRTIWCNDYVELCNKLELENYDLSRKLAQKSEILTDLRYKEKLLKDKLNTLESEKNALEVKYKRIKDINKEVLECYTKK